MKAYLCLLLTAAVCAAMLCGCSVGELNNALGHAAQDSPIYDNRDDTVTDAFLPGARWLDEDGQPIQAHGGQVSRMPVDDASTYIWVGEDKRSGHTGNCVSVYASEDLYHWRFGGDVLRVPPSREALDADPYFTALYGACTPAEKDEIYAVLNPFAVIERPKMLYNEKNDNYVIWFHSDGNTPQNDYLYDIGMAGVAVSDSPFGPFRLLGRSRLSRCPEDQLDSYQRSKGEARDLNLFLDEDGTAYVTYTSENNKTLYISRLNEDFTGLCKDPAEAVHGVDYIRLFPGAMREAPVLLRHEGRYYLMSSSTTGWASNQARVWWANEIFGTWHNQGNPCLGSEKNITFDTQSTSIFEAENGQWIYYGDRWNNYDLPDSRYVWLPVRFEDGKLTITWQSAWRWD